MKKIFLDTNFILDYFTRGDMDGSGEKLLRIGAQKNYEFYLSYLSVANFAYIMRKFQTEEIVKKHIYKM